MRSRSLLFLAALASALGTLTPAVSAAVRGDPAWQAPGPGRPDGRLAPAGASTARAYLRAARSSFADLGAPAELAASDGSIEFTAPFGRLDGDQTRDLVTSRFVPRSDYDPDLSLRYYRGYDITIRGRSGTNGQTLWTYTDKAAAAYAMPMRVPSGDGVLVASYEINYVNGSAVYAWVYSLKLTALDGTGATLWTKTLAGPEGHVNFVGGGGGALPLLRGLLDAVAGPSDDILVDTVDKFRSNRAGQHPVRVEASVLDGATGNVASRAFRTVGNADYYLEPFVIPAGDLDGDGLDDCLFVLQTSVDAPSALAASKGSDGAELWSTGAVSFGGGISIMGLGDATGDGADDLAVANFAAAPQPGVFLISGRTGTVAWSGPGRSGFPIGDAGGDARPDMGVLEFGWDGSTLSARLAAVTGTGAVVYSETQAIPDLDGGQNLSGLLELIGDVDEDEVVDMAVRLSGTVEGAVRSLHVLVDGASGQVARELRGESPLGGSTDGDGADLRQLSAADGGGVDLQITDGHSGDERWKATLGPGKIITETQIYPADIDGDGRDEIVANAMGSFGTELRVLSADGTTAWTG